MKDYDVKSIERYQKKIKKEMSRESRTFESRRLSFEKPSQKLSDKEQPSDMIAGEVPTESSLFSDEPTINQKTKRMEPQPECLALSVVEQPPNDDYVEADGIDNLSGRRVHSIIWLSERTTHDNNEPSADDAENFTGQVRENSLNLPSVIYLPGDIYIPTFGEKLRKKIFTGRLAAAIFMLSVFLVPIYILSSVGTICYLNDEAGQVEANKIIWTTVNSPREIAESFTELDKADRVDVENFGSTRLLNIVRSYPVSVVADGNTSVVKVLDTTVSELIEQEGIKLSGEDILSMDMGCILSEGDEVVIQRVTYKLQEPVIGVIPFGQVKKSSPVLSREKEIVLSEGTDGVISRVYINRYIDGVLEYSELYEEIVIEEPVSEYILCGDPSVPASVVDKSKYTDVEIIDGVPTEYIDVIPDAICTAYSFGPKAFGASGMMLIQGFVATDPEVIPYGTLMYIASDRFVYGWAIAADCGEAMMAGYVDIDCYFETYEESVMFGKKLLNVYIISRLTQSQLEEYMANGMFYNRVPQIIEEPENPV